MAIGKGGKRGDLLISLTAAPIGRESPPSPAATVFLHWNHHITTVRSVFANVNNQILNNGLDSLRSQSCYFQGHPIATNYLITTGERNHTCHLGPCLTKSSHLSQSVAMDQETPSQPQKGHQRTRSAVKGKENI